jgi:hypothetical protein
MAGQRERNGAKRAVALLATCLVVLMGSLGCATIVVASGTDLVGPLVITVGCFLAISFLLWLIRDCRPDNMAAIRWGWLGRRRRRVEYRLMARPVSPERPVHRNSEPTAESVRALRGGINTWVPIQDASRHVIRSGTCISNADAGRSS